MFGWLIAGIAGLDLAVKNEIEREKEEEFPRDVPYTKGLLRLYRLHNDGLPVGLLRGKPELVKLLPMLSASAAFGAFSECFKAKRRPVRAFGFSLLLGGALSNLYDRFMRGYVVDYLRIEKEGFDRLIFNLGDVFVLFGSLICLGTELAGEVRLCVKRSRLPFAARLLKAVRKKKR